MINPFLKEAVPCSICGEHPIIQGRTYGKRLVCPNYKSEKIPHGNLSDQTIPRGFTAWRKGLYTQEQENEAIKDCVDEWNRIHRKDK